MLAGVSVTVAGIAAPVYSVSNVNGQEQVNFQVPFAVAGRSTAAVIVTRDGQASASVDVPVSAIQPGVYTSDGTQAIVVHNADYTLATAARPLERDEYAFLYVSGLGAVANAPADGAGGPVSPPATAMADVRVTLGGLALRGAVRGAGAGVRGCVPGEFPRAGGCGQRGAGYRGQRERCRVSGGTGERTVTYFFFDNGGAVGGVVGGVPLDLPSSTTSPNLMVERPSYFL